MEYADSLGFLDLQGKLPKINPDIALSLIHCTAAPPPPWGPTDKVGIVKAAREFGNVLESQGAVIVKTLSDLWKPGLKVILGLQSPVFPSSEKELSETIGHLRKIGGILISGIAYKDENPYGGGFLFPDTFLDCSAFSFLHSLSQEGMILDLSHAGHKTAELCLALLQEESFSLPVIATHGGCYEIYRNHRNLPDFILKEIACRGGLVGVYTLTFGLHENDNGLMPFLAHLTHALDVCGEDAVCVGTDGVYQTIDRELSKTQFAQMKDKLDPEGRMGVRFPDQPVELNTPKKMEVLYDFIAKWHGERIAEKVCGKNFFSFLSRVL